MAVNEDNEDQRKGRAIGRIASQAGLNAAAVDRGESMSREEGVKAPRAKSLPLKMHPGMIQGIPPQIMNQPKNEESEQTVAGAAAQGFAGGFIAGAQNRMFGASGDGGQDDVPELIDHRTVPTNEKGQPLTPDEYLTLSRQRHAIEKASIERGEMELRSIVPGEDRTRMEAALNSRRQLFQDSVTRTDAFEHSMRSQGSLAPTNSPAVETTTPNPVRNADGKSLADLTAPAPGEDPLPGMSQPLLLDALDAVQGVPPRRAAKGVARSVVMNPAHVAGLASLENGHEESLESAGSHFGR